MTLTHGIPGCISRTQFFDSGDVKRGGKPLRSPPQRVDRAAGRQPQQPVSLWSAPAASERDKALCSLSEKTLCYSKRQPLPGDRVYTFSVSVASGQTHTIKLVVPNKLDLNRLKQAKTLQQWLERTPIADALCDGRFAVEVVHFKQLPPLFYLTGVCMAEDEFDELDMALSNGVAQWGCDLVASSLGDCVQRQIDALLEENWPEADDEEGQPAAKVAAVGAKVSQASERYLAQLGSGAIHPRVVAPTRTSAQEPVPPCSVL